MNEPQYTKTYIEPALPDAPKMASFARLHALVAATNAASKETAATRSWWDEFYSARTVGESLRAWFGTIPQLPRRALCQHLTQEIASIDRLLNDQLNAILHHPSFQALEASWRGLRSLVDRVDAEGATNIKVRVLNISWREVERDIERATEFDGSQIFKKIYENEFGTPGGLPYGAVLADFKIRPFPSLSYPHDDIGLLKSLSQVAAAAFCPLLIGVDPSMFGLDNFEELEQTLDHASTFDRLEFLKWRDLRDSEDARFLGVVLPQALMRAPYQDDGSRVDRFCFQEEVGGPDRQKYLWGSAVYPLGCVLIRAFAQTGWFANIRGVHQNFKTGGLVTDLPSYSFETDQRGVMPRISTRVAITDELERQLSDLGFISLCHCQDSPHAAFVSTPSLQKPKKYDRMYASSNAKISAMLQHIFCASRFAHYLKVMGRDKVGSFGEAHELERYLHNWIVKYVTSDGDASNDTKSRFPLREAKVTVEMVPGKPGAYNCVMHLVPHYELDNIEVAIGLKTEIAPSRAN